MSADESSFHAGQRAGIECACTVICPYCHRGFYGRGAINSLVRDGMWRNDDMQTAQHVVGGKVRKCRAARLILLLSALP